MNMTRREFVFCCSAALISAMSGASGAILPQKSRAGAFARRKRSYSVPVLGDIHTFPATQPENSGMLRQLICRHKKRRPDEPDKIDS